MIVERGGYIGLKKMFTKKFSGKPRATVAKRIIDIVYQCLY